MQIFDDRIRFPTVQSPQKIVFQPLEAAEIATFRLFPGMSIDVLEHFLARPLRGLILETYGDGNGPTNDPEFVRVLRKAVDSGIVILGCTQCLHGGMTQANYATGTVLTKAGVVPGRDMTIEACLTKLLFLLSQQISVDEIRAQLANNLAGELTPKP